MTLSEFIKNYRKEHNLSQRKFAQKCGVSNGYISMIENEKNPCTGKEISLTTEKLKALSDGMGVSFTFLINAMNNRSNDLSVNCNIEIDDPMEKALIELYHSVPDQHKEEILKIMEKSIKRFL